MASTIVPKKVMPERLRIVLNHFGLTQSKLGGLIGFRHSIISLWLRGKNKMPQAAAMAIQAALGVRWQWTLYGDGEMLLDDMGVLSAEEVPLLTNSEPLQRHKKAPFGASGREETMKKLVLPKQSERPERQRRHSPSYRQPLEPSPF